MKKNLYFRQALQRRIVNKAILISLINVTSLPRLLLEVFIRKNFGERYFTMGAAKIILFVLTLLPLYFIFISFALEPNTPKWLVFLKYYTSWYAFIIAFYYLSKKRNEELARNPSVFDFGKYSLYAGDMDARFFKFKLFKIESDIRRVETLIEPAFFFVMGLILILLSQKLGYLLMGCSLFYSLGYRAAYELGDEFIMDKIDEMICNEELEKAFVGDADTSETRGFRHYGRKPADPEKRKKLMSEFFEEEESVEAR